MPKFLLNRVGFKTCLYLTRLQIVISAFNDAKIQIEILFEFNASKGNKIYKLLTIIG